MTTAAQLPVVSSLVCFKYLFSAFSFNRSMVAGTSFLYTTSEADIPKISEGSIVGAAVTQIQCSPGPQ